MSLEYIRYDLKSHRPDDLIAAYRVACEQLQAAPECLGYELVQCEEDPSSLILRIRWQSTEAHLQGFRRGPHFAAFLNAIRPFIPEIAEMRHYQTTELSWQRDEPRPAS